MQTNRLIAIDTETTGLSPHKGHIPFLLGAEYEGSGKVWKFDLRRDVAFCHDIMGKRNTKLAKLRKDIENPNIIKVAHNANFDIRMIRTMGWKPAGEWWCTMNMCVLNDEYSRLSLKYLSERHFKQKYETSNLIDIWLAATHRQRRDMFAEAGLSRDLAKEPTYEEFYELMPDIMSSYLEEDLDNVLRLALMWRKPCTTMYGKGKVFKGETDLVPVVASMEDAGIPINVDFCFQAKEHYTKSAVEQKSLMFDIAGRHFNPNSHPQLKKVLHEQGHFVKNTRKETLKLLDGDFPKALLEYRADFKIAGWFKTFLADCTKKGVIHPSFWQNGQNKGIKTGRFSITDPGFQTLPAGYHGTVGQRGIDVRRAVVARSGHRLFLIDYAQVEPRVLAHYTQDPRLLKALNNGVDIYLAFIKIFFGSEVKRAFRRLALCSGDMSELARRFPKTHAALKQRRADAKTLILAIMYGMGVKKLAHDLGISTAEAQKMKSKCFIAMPTMRKLMRDSQQKVARNGYITDEAGRRYRVPRTLSYKAINAIIQGFSAIIMKRALVACMKVIDDWNEIYNSETPDIQARMLLTVHDEIMFEIPIGQEDELVPMLQQQMIKAAPELTVPLDADVSWCPDKLTPEGGFIQGSWGEKVDWEVGDAEKPLMVRIEDASGVGLQSAINR